MPGPAGQHTLILHQDWGYEKGNGAVRDPLADKQLPCRPCLLRQNMKTRVDAVGNRLDTG